MFLLLLLLLIQVDNLFLCVYLLKAVKKLFLHYNYHFCPLFPAFSHLLHTEKKYFFTLCTNRILKHLTRNLIFHMRLCQVPKGKRRVSFPCRKQVFFTTNELQRSQQTLLSGVSFPKQVSRPPLLPSLSLSLTLSNSVACSGWFGLGSPGCRRCAHMEQKKNTGPGTLKEKRVFGKGRLGWGVEETCRLTLAALIAAHSRWINAWIYFKLTFTPLLSLSFLRHTSMPKTDNALWHCALMVEFIDIFIRVGPKCKRREAVKTIFVPEVL